MLNYQTSSLSRTALYDYGNNSGLVSFYSSAAVFLQKSTVFS